MIVTCEQCRARFRLPDDKVGPEGAKVRCSKCHHTFVVHRDEELELADIDDVTLVADDTGAAKSPAIDEHQVEGIGEWRPGMPAGKPPRPKDAGPERPASASGEAAVDFGAGGGFHEQVTGVQDVGKITVRDKDDTEGYGNNPAFVAAVHEARTRVIKVPTEAELVAAREEEIGKRMTEPNLDSAIVDPDLNFDDEATEQTVESLADVDPFAAGAAPEGNLADELFSDLPPAEEGELAPFDPFESAADAAIYRKATRQLSEIPGGVDIGGAKPEQSSRVSMVVNGLIASAGVAILVLGLAFFFAGDALLALANRGARPIPLPASEGVRVLSTRSVRYPTTAGEDVLVISGTAENQSEVDRNDLFVVAELRTGGKTLAKGRAPVGLPLTPHELAGLRDEASVGDAFAERAAAVGVQKIAKHGRAGFTVVLLSPPSGDGLAPALRLERGAPIAAAASEPSEPAEPAAASADAAQKGKSKGKRRKGKRRKGKRRKGKKSDAE